MLIEATVISLSTASERAHIGPGMSLIHVRSAFKLCADIHLSFLAVRSYPTGMHAWLF